MSLRQKIRVSLGILIVSIVLIVAGVCLKHRGMIASGLLVYSVFIVIALLWWRCPNCGKGFNPPFTKKKCLRCGLEIDYGAREKKYS